MSKRKIDRFARYGIISIILIVMQSGFAIAQNRFYVKIMSVDQATIELQNSDLIAGIQFILHSASNLSLNSLQKEERLSDAAWIVSTHIVNDTTIRVMAINLNLDQLPSGIGSIARINFKKDFQSTVSASKFRLSDIILADKNGKDVPVDTQEVNNIHIDRNHTGSDFSLLHNYPNPFNPVTTISYLIENTFRVRLTIYDITGKLVRTLSDDVQSAGYHDVAWNSTNDWNEDVASGTYICRLQTGTNLTTKKLLLAK